MEFYLKMFRLSQKADYGLILLSSLASHARPDYVSINAVAKKNRLSPKFLSQVAHELRKEGILASKEGVTGGYTLAKSAQQIKLLDVLRVLEGKFFNGKCFEEKGRCICGANTIWKDMKNQVEAVLGGKSVADLVKSKTCSHMSS